MLRGGALTPVTYAARRSLTECMPEHIAQLERELVVVEVVGVGGDGGVVGRTVKMLPIFRHSSHSALSNLRLG